jgi:hypothetical protein
MNKTIFVSELFLFELATINSAKRTVPLFRRDDRRGFLRGGEDDGVGVVELLLVVTMMIDLVLVVADVHVFFCFIHKRERRKCVILGVHGSRY